MTELTVFQQSISASFPEIELRFEESMANIPLSALAAQ